MRPIPSLRRLALICTSAAVGLLARDPLTAQEAGGLSGTWVGEYVCGQGRTGLRLELREEASGVVRGVFRFFALAGNPGVPTGAYPLLGTLAGPALALQPVDVREMPGDYLPVGLLGTVGQGGRRMEGRVQGAACRDFTLRKAVDAGPRDPLPGGYGAQRWAVLAAEDAWSMYADSRPPVDAGGSTVRVWARWEFHVANAAAGVAAGEALEYDLEYDCAAGLARAWSTVAYAPGGALARFDGVAPFRWAPVVKGSADGLLFEHACAQA